MNGYDKNLVHYAVVTGIIVREGKYLIAKRAEWEKAFPGKWSVPGGKLKVLDYILKKKDTRDHWYNIFENVLISETAEEVGLNIKCIGYITSMVYIRSDDVPCLIVSLYAHAEEGEVKLCNALSEYKWVNLEEAKKYDLVEGLYEEIEMLDKLLNGVEAGQWKKN